MDIKRLVIGMALAMALMFGWQYVIVKMYERHPEWKKPGQETAQTESPATHPTTLATTTGPSA